MKQYFIDNTIAQLERCKAGDMEFADCVIEDALLVIRELNKELTSPEFRKVPFVPGEKVFVKVGNKVHEGTVKVSGIFYDERHSEPLYSVSYGVNADGIPVRMKWFSSSLRDKPYKTYEEAVEGENNE